MAGGNVPIKKRVTVWASCVVVGVASFFVFNALLTAGPRDEAERVEGKIEAARARAIGQSPSAEKGEAATAKGRSRAGLINALHTRLGEARQSRRSNSGWAAFIGLAAGCGCFALSSAYWLKRGVV